MQQEQRHAETPLIPELGPLFDAPRFEAIAHRLGRLTGQSAAQ